MSSRFTDAVRAAACLLVAVSSAFGEVALRTVPPMATDPEINDVELPNAEGIARDHAVAVGPEADRNGLLFLFLPGTGAAPLQYAELIEHAAQRGYHAVGLTYKSVPGVNYITVLRTDPELPELMRRERLFGEALTDEIEVSRADSVVNRAEKLLAYLAAAHPGEGWDRYLLPGGGLAWNRVVASGQSQGAGHAAFLSKRVRLAGASMFAGPGDFVRDFGAAPWLTGPAQTPPGRLTAFTHVRDDTAAGFFSNQRLLGMEAFGPLQNIDGLPAEDVASTMLTSTLVIPGTNYHNCVAADEFLPRDDAGSNLYAPVWDAMLDRHADVAPPADRAADFRAVTRFLEDNAAAFAPGMRVIVERDGSRLYEHAVGDPPAEDEPVEIASATKWISAAVILALAEDGVLSLDDVVADTVQAMADNGKGGWTVRQAFAMTSGLTDAPGAGDQRFHTDPTLTHAQSVARIAALTPEPFAPGTVVSYDGKAMQVAGWHAVLKAADGRDWRDLARDTILAPLGMDDTAYDAFGVNPAVAAGATSTAADYLRFLRMLHRGGLADDGSRVLGSALDELFAYPNDGLAIDQSATPFGPGDWYPRAVPQPRYGFGSWVLAFDPLTRRATELHSAGAYGATPFLDAERDIYGLLWARLPLGHGATELQMKLVELIRRAVDDAETRDRPIGPADTPLADPEFLSGPHRAVYQDVAGNAWLARVDPATGFFFDGTSPDHTLLDTGLTSMLATNNGPEFGVDAQGWSVFYTKRNGPLDQTWRGTLDQTGAPAPAPLTAGSPSRFGCVVSRDPDAPSVLVAYRSRIAGDDEVRWLDEQLPGVERTATLFERGQTPIGFMPGNQQLVVSRPDALGVLQLDLLDATGSGPPEPVTWDPEDKTYPNGFRAPELGGEPVVVAVRGSRTLVAYARRGSLWTPIAEMAMPDASPYALIGSPEPFAFRGRTFVSLQFEDEQTGVSNGEIWVFGLPLAGFPEIRIRCDDLGPPAPRTDPEFLVTPHGVFVYYNLVRTDGVIETRRVRTGLARLVGDPVDLNHDGAADFFDAARGLAALHAGALEADLNRDRVPDALDADRLLELLAAGE